MRDKKFLLLYLSMLEMARTLRHDAALSASIGIATKRNCKFEKYVEASSM
jgi:hypothetical protein